LFQQERQSVEEVAVVGRGPVLAQEPAQRLKRSNLLAKKTQLSH
jgi:hypothetical protein